MKHQVLESNSLPPLVVLYNKRPNRRLIQLLKVHFSETFLVLIGSATAITTVHVAPDYALICIMACLIYFSVKRMIARFYQTHITVFQYQTTVSDFWESENVTIIRSIGLSIFVLLFTFLIYDRLQQIDTTTSNIPNILWLLFLLGPLLAIRGGSKTKNVLLIIVFNLVVFTLVHVHYMYTLGDILAKVAWITALSLLAYTLVRYLSDLYGDIRLLRNIEEALNIAQSYLDEELVQQTFISAIRENFSYDIVNLFYIHYDDKGEPYLKCEEVANDSHNPLKRERFPLSFGIIGKVATTGVRYIDNDVNKYSKSSLYRSYPVFSQTAAELVVPIKLDNNIIGVLDIQSHLRNVFADEDGVILEDVAKRFSAALYSTRITHQIGELFRSTYDQAKLEDDLETVLQKLADSANKHLEADIVVLFFQDSSGIKGPFYSGHIRTPEPIIKRDHFADNSIVHQLFQSNLVQSIIFDDDAHNSKLEHIIQNSNTSMHTSFVEREGIKSRVIARLDVDVQHKGLIFLNYRTPKKFESSDKQWWQANKQLLITAFIQLSTVAIENIYKHDRNLANQRLHVGRMLHETVLSSLRLADRLNQKIASACHEMPEYQEMVNDLGDLLSELYQEVKFFEDNFAEIPSISLFHEITNIVRWIKIDGVDCILDWRLKDRLSLPDDRTSVIKSVLREAKENAIRYGNPSLITIIVDKNENGLFIELKDDGKGFDPNSVLGTEDGLFYMKYETETLLGGQFGLSSNPGSGTTVSIHLPVSVLGESLK